MLQQYSLDSKTPLTRSSLFISLLFLGVTTLAACGSSPAGGTACGELGEACCAGRLCDNGTCNGGNGGVCAACGAPGQACCDLGICGGNDCCVNDICTGEGSTCPSVGGMCSAGSCGDGTCGAPGQPCCQDTCTAGAVDCQNGSCAICGGPGEPCCDNECGPDLACEGGSCRTCGGPGEPCCAGDSCDSGCCDPRGDVCVADGATCRSGGVCEVDICLCLDGQEDCGNGCTDITADVDHCGGCGISCGDTEYCSSSICECRPGLVRGNGGACVDPLSNPMACGSGAVACGGGTPVCANGACAADCGGLEQCSNACVDFETDPLHCGECGKRCNNDEVCVQGDCRNFDAEPSCNSCPCAACGGDECCAYPGDMTATICVDADACPQ